MELYYWPAETAWRLPSFDIDSLYALTFIKFSRCPAVLRPTAKSWLHQHNINYPCLRASSMEAFSGSARVIGALRLKYYDADTWMSKEERLKVAPLVALIEDTLLPAVQAVFWLHEDTYTSITRPSYAKFCPYLGGNYYPSAMKNEIEAKLFSQGRLSKDDNAVNVLHSDAIKCLNMMSSILKENEYLLGQQPCSLDARLFSVIAPLLNVLNPPSRKLAIHLTGCQNLCDFVKRILDRYFVEELLEKDVKAKSSVMENLGEYTTYDWLFPTAIATITMVSYAISIGVLSHG